jgi:hypothetical protein
LKHNLIPTRRLGAVVLMFLAAGVPVPAAAAAGRVFGGNCNLGLSTRTPGGTARVNFNGGAACSTDVLQHGHTELYDFSTGADLGRGADITCYCKQSFSPGSYDGAHGQQVVLLLTIDLTTPTKEPWGSYPAACYRHDDPSVVTCNVTKRYKIP